MPMRKGRNMHKKIYDIIKGYHNQNDFTTITTEELGARVMGADENLKKEVQDVLQKEMNKK